MILDYILDKGFAFINFWLDSMNIPSISFSISAMDPFLDIVANVAYFFPWTYIAPVLGFIFMLQLFRIAIAILKLIGRVLELIPLY